MNNNNLLESLRGSWFLILFLGGVIWWAARNDYSLGQVGRIDLRTTGLENRIATVEANLGQLQLKIDAIKEDLVLIKTAVIK